MAEQTTPVMTPPFHAAPEKKKKSKKIVKNVLLVLVILAVVAAAAWAIWYFVFTEHKGAAGEPIYDTAQIGSIVSTVRGGGSPSPWPPTAWCRRSMSPRARRSTPGNRCMWSPLPPRRRP